MFSSLKERTIGTFRTPLAFQKRSAASLDLVGRLELQKTLEGHHGCVNTVSFNDSGSILVSGSDDQRIILWNYFSGKQLLSFQSGHSNNIFQARIMPHSNDSTLVTCAADGQVRLAQLREGGSAPQTSRLASHGGRAHKLALDPLSPSCFYSCGEDGRVYHLDLRARNARQSLLVCTKPKRGHGTLRERLQLHSIHCNPLRPHQFVLGGSDIFTRVYDQRRSLTAGGTDGEPPTPASSLAEPVRNLAPNNLRNCARQLTTTCHVTCAVFSQCGEIVATYNDENIYLFRSEGPSPSVAHKRPAAAESSLRKRTRSRSEALPDGLMHPPTPLRRSTRLSAAQAVAESPSNTVESAGGEAPEGAPEMAAGREEARMEALRRTAQLRSAVLAEWGADEAGNFPNSASGPVRTMAARPAERSAEGGVTNEAASPSRRLPPGRGGHSLAERSAEGGVNDDTAGPSGRSQPGRAFHSPAERSAEGGVNNDTASPSGRSRAGRGGQGEAGGVAGNAWLAGSGAQHAEAMDAGGGEGGMESEVRANTAREPERQHESFLQEGQSARIAAMRDYFGAEFDELVFDPANGPEDSEDMEVGSGHEWLEEEPESASEAENHGDIEVGSGAESPEEDPQSFEEGPHESEGGWVTASSEQSGSDDSDGSFSTTSGSVSGDDGEAMAELMRQGGLRTFVANMTEAQLNAILGMEQGMSVLGPPEDNIDDEVLMQYTGHRNRRTVKGVSFLGQSDEYVMSGSDDGQIYIWTKADGVLRQWLTGDSHVVNCLEPHPALPMSFATSGIDDDIKLWAPTADVPAGVPAWATRIHERNRRNQQPYRMPIPEPARTLLLNMRHFMAE